MLARAKGVKVARFCAMHMAYPIKALPHSYHLTNSNDGWGGYLMDKDIFGSLAKGGF